MASSHDRDIDQLTQVLTATNINRAAPMDHILKTAPLNSLSQVTEAIKLYDNLIEYWIEQLDDVLIDSPERDAYAIKQIGEGRRCVYILVQYRDELEAREAKEDELTESIRKAGEGQECMDRQGEIS